MTNEFAIKVLTELKGYGDKFANIGFDRKEALDMAIKALEQKSYKSEARRWKRRYLDLKQRIFKLEEQTRWIPVSERLPEVGEDVLVTDGTKIWLGWIDVYYRWRVSYLKNFIKGAIAWQPLPEPYKTESEGEE